jgi:hypothetical protein
MRIMILVLINSDNLEKTFDNNIEEKRINHFVINKLSLPQLYELLYELGICSKPLLDDNDENENPIQEEEKMLVIKLYEILKDKDEMVENDKLLKFLISVLGLHYYDLYRVNSIKAYYNLRERYFIYPKNYIKWFRSIICIPV